jgi:hypothetical protein
MNEKSVFSMKGSFNSTEKYFGIYIMFDARFEHYSQHEVGDYE